MNKQILLVACIVLTVLSGVLRGRIDYRWGVSEEFQVAAERVNSIPTVLGRWKTESLGKLDKQAKQMLRCTGDVFGSYTNPSGEQVNMTFLVGPAGPLAIHTAEVCYGSSNYTVLGQVDRQTLVDDAGEEHQFAVVMFEENRAGNRPLKVYYAWNEDGKWIAPETPRSAFTGTAMLHKIQVATMTIDDESGQDAAAKFLRQNLPKLQQICDLRAKTVTSD